MRNSKLVSFAKHNQIGTALVMSVLLFAFTIIMNPRALNANAFGAIFSTTSMLLLAAAGQTLVIVSDGIDMSTGAVMSMTGVMTAGMMQGREGYVVWAFLAAIAVGALVGLVNGLGAVKLKLPPMIVTLCVANVVTRLQYVMTEGKPTGTTSVAFTDSINTRLAGAIPTIIFYALAVFLVVTFLLRYSRYGMQLFLTGSNPRAAFLNGIRTDRLKMFNYSVAGALSGIAGVIGAGSLNFVKCSTFDDYTMKSIVAVIIGGTLISGGKGSYTGTLAGALLLTILTNMLNSFQMSSVITDMVMGVLLILILSAYNRSKAIRQ